MIAVVEQMWGRRFRLPTAGSDPELAGESAYWDTQIVITP